MNHRNIVLLSFAFIFHFAFGQISYENPERPVINLRKSNSIVVAFGSCNKQFLDQPLWKDIGENNPDLFIWAGDNIYADTENMDKMRKKYMDQLENKDYLNFIQFRNIIGTWDDHDYGKDDAGKEFEKKKESRDNALNFLNVDKANPVWNREGLYQSYMLGQNDVKIILLDTRYFRDRLVRIGKNISVNEGGDILGEEQWKWLDQELRKNEGQRITIVVSSIQVIPTEHPYEKWGNFPKARMRLFEMLHYSDAPNVIFISGDRHMGELSVMEYKGKNYYEITSSGLTHIWENMPKEENKYRRGMTVNELNFGLITIQNEGPFDRVSLQIRGRKNRVLQALDINMLH